MTMPVKNTQRRITLTDAQRRAAEDFKEAALIATWPDFWALVAWRLKQKGLPLNDRSSRRPRSFNIHPEDLEYLQDAARQTRLPIAELAMHAISMGDV